MTRTSHRKGARSRRSSNVLRFTPSLKKSGAMRSAIRAARWPWAVLIASPFIGIGIAWGWSSGNALPDEAAMKSGAAATAEQYSVVFSACGSGPRYNCIVDGDTFWLRGEKIRIADINTPEVGTPRCPEEARLGAKATGRLLMLLNKGGFSLRSIDRDTDPYDRKLRIVTRSGESLGQVLVDEGLAEGWAGRRREWC